MSELPSFNNRNEVISFVRNHFRRQGALGKASSLLGPGGDCVYRDSGTGCKCSIGCLIPDWLYDKIVPSIDEGVHTVGFLIEGRGAGALPGIDEDLDGLLKNLANVGFNNNLLCCLQDLHDNVAEDAADFDRLLLGFAAGMGSYVSSEILIGGANE